MKKMKLAIYGGAFNPPHPGHASVIKTLLEQAEIILVVPSFAHPFGKIMAPYSTRCKWVEQMCVSAGFDPRQVIGSNAEEVMVNEKVVEGPVFSIDLLRFAGENFGLESREVALVMGEDNAKIFPTFHGYQEIVDEFSVIVINETLNLHSTMIRKHLNLHGSLPQEWMIEGLTLADYSELLEKKNAA
jgi:nicotinate-nucleotide adenylyltransferase